ncbi:MAG: DUF3102 domain-containing protein [Ramlibacter sp.]|nr:DUF3102 domain-containing protein [Ramlibacter sp.]
MNSLRINIAADINRLHELASSKAEEAVDHAIEAGKLLLEAKSALPHGDWLGWLDSNVFVTSRQVQRYMRAAQGKPMPARIFSRTKDSQPKTTPVSHLPGANILPIKDGFSAIADHFMVVLHKKKLYCIEQSTTPGFFFVSCLESVGDDDAVVDYLAKPIRGDYVDLPLKGWGLDEPQKVAWQWGKMAMPVATALTSQEMSA